jgi:hypothetical protein
MKKLTLIAAIIVAVLTITGCEYQTKTERRIAWFWKGENGGDVYRSRDVNSSFRGKRSGNVVDEWLRRNVSDRVSQKGGRR